MDYATMMQLEHQRTRETLDWFEAIDSIRRRCSNLSRCLRDAGALFAAGRRGRLKGWADGYAARAGHEADIRAGFPLGTLP